jgi:hypothetical protein
MTGHFENGKWIPRSINPEEFKPVLLVPSYGGFMFCIDPSDPYYDDYFSILLNKKNKEFEESKRKFKMEDPAESFKQHGGLKTAIKHKKEDPVLDAPLETVTGNKKHVYNRGKPHPHHTHEPGTQNKRSYYDMGQSFENGVYKPDPDWITGFFNKCRDKIGGWLK